MKKFLSMLLVGVMCISLCACGGNDTETTDTTNTEEKVEETEAEKYHMGDTVSTDIIEFTLDNAEFAIACDDNFNSSNYMMPKEYDSVADSNNLNVASIGETFVAITFTVTNNNRTTLYIADSFNGWDLLWNVSYNSENYELMEQFNDVHGIEFNCAAVLSEGTDWCRQDTTNDIIGAGETISYRTYGRISTEVENLDDSFEIDINIPNSNGEDEHFIFVIE